MEQVSNNRQNFNPNVHGLRGLAALFVLLYHFFRGATTAGGGHIQNGYNFWPQDFIHHLMGFILETFFSGIHIFFMISGYLITYTLIHLNSVPRFAVNRCLRIYPAFLATQAVMFSVGPMIGWKWMANLTVTDYFYYLLINILFLPGVFNFPIALEAAWTLSYEAVFYIIAGCIFYLSKLVNKSLMIVLVISISMSVFFSVSFAFVPGVLAYFILKKWPEKIAILDIPLIPFFSFCAMIVGLKMSSMYQNFLFTLMIDIISLITFIYLVRGYGLIAYILRSNVFQFLGTISYSLYLWHVPVMFITKRISLLILPSGSSSYLIFYTFLLLTLPIVITFSYFSYRTFEVIIPTYIKTLLQNKKDAIFSTN